MAFLARGANLGLKFLLGFLIWLLNHPYQGVWHDARIYALLAAHWMNPAAYASDLFFQFGSQSGLSLFNPLFGGLVSLLGLSDAAWWIVMLGGVLWIAACLAVARTMLGSGPVALFAVVLGAVAIVSYSPNGSTFVLGENFATARLLAIPFGLFSIASLAAQRPWWALGFGLLAAAMHPLHGVWPLALWVLTRTSIRTTGLLALIPIGAVVLIGLLVLDFPYLRMLTGAWLEFAWVSAPDIVFRTAAQSRLPVYVGVLLALWLGARFGSQQWRSLYLRLLLLGGSGLGLALVVSYWLPVEIVVQGQSWRVMALLIPMAVVAILDLVQRLWLSSRTGRLLVCVAVILISMRVSWLQTLVYVMWMASLMPRAWLATILARTESWGERWQYWLQGGLVLLALVVLPNILVDWDLFGRQLLNPWWTGLEWLHGLIAGNNWHLAAVAALALGGAGSVDFSSTEIRRKLFLVARAGIFAALGLITLLTLGAWDRRPEQFSKELDCHLARTCPPHPFRQWVTPGATVFWPERELTVWFELGTASYFGEIQATGRVFSFRKFYEFQRREAWIAKGIDPIHLCVDPILDWVVLPQEVPDRAVRSLWRNWYLYACKDFRTVSPAPTIEGAAT